jgi:hypothetical protein
VIVAHLLARVPFIDSYAPCSALAATSAMVKTGTGSFAALHREAIMHLEKRRVEAILVRVFEFRGVRADRNKGRVYTIHIYWRGQI